MGTHLIQLILSTKVIFSLSGMTVFYWNATIWETKDGEVQALGYTVKLCI